jgi:hypothetical protein
MFYPMDIEMLTIRWTPDRYLFLDIAPITLVHRENHSNLCHENWGYADSYVYNCQF